MLLALVAAVYWPAVHGGFVWDDDAYFTYNRIKAPDGLYHIWLTTDCADYWPVTSTTLWLEWRLWGGHTFGYHLTNLVLHGGEALLLWAVLRRLGLRGAYVAALLFAVHPVNVESVAWIAERKNLMAMLFALLTVLALARAGLTAGRFQANRWYGLSLLAFLLALLSKASVAPLPVVLLGLVGWARRPSRRDLGLLLPFFGLAVAFAKLNVWFEEHGYVEVVRDVSPGGRLAGAGMVVWFYLSKALLPLRLIMIYPNWALPAGDFRIWLPLGAAAAFSAWLWRARAGAARGTLFAWADFCVMLVPVLGFTDIYFMRYALVADHYQHLAMIALLALAGAGWARWQAWRPRGATAAAVVTVGALATLSWSQAGLYRDAETLYLATLRENPDSWLAHNNLGMLWARDGRVAEATSHFRRALQLNPNFAQGHSNLGVTFADSGHPAEALAEFRTAVQLEPILADAHNGLGNTLVETGHLEEGLAELREALRLQPDYPEARNNLGNALAKSGHWAAAVPQYEEALRLRPDFPAAGNNLGVTLEKTGRLAEGIVRLQEVVRLHPAYADAWFNLGLLLHEAGREAEARPAFLEAAQLRADAR